MAKDKPDIDLGKEIESLLSRVKKGREENDPRFHVKDETIDQLVKAMGLPPIVRH